MIKKIIHSVFKKFDLKIIRLQESKNQNQFDDNIILNGDTTPPFNDVPFAGETLQYMVENYDFETVLDIGSGEGKHSSVFKKCDKIVTSIDFGRSIYFEKSADNHSCIFGDYYTYQFDKKFDAIWASHVLEHQPNPNLFLTKIHKDLREGGVLAITVPPLKNEIVGGHVTLWNAGLILYQLVLAGFNCKHASIKSYGYNVSVVLNKVSISQYPELSYDNGDINKLRAFFPDGLSEPFNGVINVLNWK